MNVHEQRNAPLATLLEEARADFAAKRPNTLAAHEQAAQHMPGGNTRTVLYHGPFPVRVDGGSSASIKDLDGNEYVNFLGEYSAGIFGHSNEAIQNAVVNAVESGMNLGAHNDREPELARLVCERFPAIEKVRFTNSGTEANLMAIATARAVSGKEKVVVFEGGYHGALLYFGPTGSPINAPFPYLTAQFNDLASVESIIAEQGDSIACIIVEAMQGSGGCIPAEPGFVEGLAKLASDAGIMLVLDEVMTSRFGRHGAHHMYGIEPDLITLGKWVGGGMSFGAFGGKASIMDHYDPERPGAFAHAGTFNNNVLSMNAGIAALTDAFPAEKAQWLHDRGEAFRHRIQEVFTKHNANFCVTGQSSLMAIHPTSEAPKCVADLASGNEAAKELLYLDLLEKGFYIASRGFIAMTIELTDAHMDGFVDALESVLVNRKAVMCN